MYPHKILHSLDRHLKDCQDSYNGQCYSLLKDVDFEDCREASQSKRCQFMCLGLGNRPNQSVDVEVEEEEVMWAKGVLGNTTLFSILFTL